MDDSDFYDYEVEEIEERRRRVKHGWHWFKVVGWTTLLAGGLYLLIREVWR